MLAKLGFLALSVYSREPKPKSFDQWPKPWCTCDVIKTIQEGSGSEGSGIDGSGSEGSGESSGWSFGSGDYYGSGDWTGLVDQPLVTGLDPNACKNLNSSDDYNYYDYDYNNGSNYQDSTLFAKLAEDGKSGIIESDPYVANVQCIATIPTKCEKVAFRLRVSKK